MTEDDEEKVSEAPRSMIKILDAENEVVDAEDYFRDIDFEDEEDDDLQILTDLFSGEADRLAAEAEYNEEFENEETTVDEINEDMSNEEDE